MLVLGIIVFVGLLVHFANFWSKMQLQEIIHGTNFVSGQNGPTDGAFLIQYTFSQWYFVLIYTVWLAALWTGFKIRSRSLLWWIFANDYFCKTDFGNFYQ